LYNDYTVPGQTCQLEDGNSPADSPPNTSLRALICVMEKILTSVHHEYILCGRPKVHNHWWT